MKTLVVLLAMLSTWQSTGLDVERLYDLAPIKEIYTKDGQIRFHYYNYVNNLFYEINEEVEFIRSYNNVKGNAFVIASVKNSVHMLWRYAQTLKIHAQNGLRKPALEFLLLTEKLKEAYRTGYEVGRTMRLIQEKQCQLYGIYHRERQEYYERKKRSHTTEYQVLKGA